MSWIRQIPAVLYKELLIEWRDLSRLSTLFFFSFALLLMLAFSSEGVHKLPDLSSGALWIGLLLASTRSLDQSFAIEMENGCLEGLVLWPVDPIAIYYGKAIANALVLFAVSVAITPLLIVLYHPVLTGSVFDLLAVMALGCFALAAPGTLVAALTTQARGSSALMPFLLFPLVIPVVMSSARATALVFQGDPMGQVDNWMQLLLVFNAAHWALDGLLFTRVVDDA